MGMGFFGNLSNAAKAALYTTLFTFLGTVGLLVLDVLKQLDEWTNTGTPPDWDASGKALVSAVIAAAAGVVNYVVRYIQAKKDPAAVPQYRK
jgi:hypothetical protein